MKGIRKNKSGFTLVEMVLVLAIIVILATVLTLSVSTIMQTARNGRDKMDQERSSATGKFNSLESKIRGYKF